MESLKKDISKNPKQNIRFKRDKDRKIIKGIFKYNELEGGTLKFSYHKYPGDPVEIYELEDGKVYELPLGVARHLNNNVCYDRHKLVADYTGIGTSVVSTPYHRTGFQSLEFIDPEDFEATDPEVLIVKKIF